MTEEQEECPVPPFPSPDSDVLQVIYETTMGYLQDGTLSVGAAVMHAAVNAWYEGHVEGEDSCPGCDFRGRAGRGIDRETWIYRARRGLLGPDER